MSKPNNLRRAAERAKAGASAAKSYEFAVQPPQLMPGIAPQGITPPVMAMDINPYQFAASAFPGGGFPGFPYLAQLSTRAEYRQMAAALSTEITREWITFTSKQDDDDDSNEKIKIIEDEFKRLNVRGVIQKVAEQDCYFGRGQIFLDIAGADRKTPLILDPRTIKQGSLERIVAVEAVWTTPSAYNALDPAAPDFYRPTSWFMLGQEVHASRLLTIVTRPLPDILKAAFNFGGMSLSQLAEPYVDNWLRTRQSVADLLNNFSITALKTSMEQILQGNDDGADLFARADLFTATRSNKGLMLLDKDREELVQVNVPLGGLHELQAQAQEHMCAVSRMPAIILTGISPSGLNASSDGEIRVFYDWIAAQQESNYREPLEIILKVVQLSKFGEIDPDIGFDFNPLYQMTPGELADIRLKDSQSATAYIDRGVVEPGEVRERLARDPASGFQGLDISVEIVPPNQPEDDEMLERKLSSDKSVSAAQHRAMEAAAHGHSTLGIPKNVGEEFVAQDADKWITVHPNGEGSTGSPVLIGENGEVKGGMGGKFNGKNIKDAHGTKEFTSGETNAETEARKSEEQKPSASTNQEGTATKSAPARPSWYQKMRDDADNPYWNGKFYGTTGNYSIFIDNKRRNISDEEKSELEKYMADKSKYDEEQKPIIEAQKAAEKAGGTYLHVPYDNREEAKKAGAKWDADKKKWYMPAGKEVPESLTKYTSAPAAQKSTSQSSSASVGKKMADMTMEELHKKARNYDLVINGGGEGYNPFTAEIQKRDAKAAANEPRQHHWAYSEEAVQRALRGEDSMPEGMGEDADPDEASEDDPRNYDSYDKSVSAAQHRAMEAAAHGHSTLGIPKKVGEEFVAQDADKWITVHPNGEGSTGSPVLIGENGEVKGGMGGKFNGKNIKDAHGTKEFTSGETNAETEARKKENTEGESKSANIGGHEFNGEKIEESKTPTRNPAVKEGHHELQNYYPYERETEKAVGIPTPGYQEARETARYDVKELSSSERDLLRNGSSLTWLPKSQISTHEGKVVGMAPWLAQKNGFSTKEGEEKRREAFEAGSKRYADLLAQAKAAGIPGVRERMKTSTIKEKMRQHGLAVDSGDEFDDEGIDYMVGADQ